MSTEELPAREAMEFDVVIVGAGPAGLAAAIRLKQLSPDITVVVVEKGSEVGAHILSGAVIDPVGLDKLLPDWRSEDTPVKTKVSDDRFYWLSASRALRIPNLLLPPLMSNHGNYVVSLGNVCRWLATKAEALGVEIYPGFAASEVLFDANGAVAGVATGDMGLAKDGHHKDSFTRGMELRAKYTLFAEGARGSLTKSLLQRFALGEGREPQKFGLGLKELWQVAPEKHAPGLVQHPSAGRSTAAPAAARSSIISTTSSCRSASWFISTTRTRTFRRSRSSSVSRPIRWCAAPSRAASGSPMARAP
jgi:electron-transferring-flavoprotein dehydrogenase